MNFIQYYDENEIGNKPNVYIYFLSEHLNSRKVEKLNFVAQIVTYTKILREQFWYRERPSRVSNSAHI